MLEDHKRCGWGAVLVAVTLFTTLLLSVPARPAAAATGTPVAVVVRYSAAGEAEASALV